MDRVITEAAMRILHVMTSFHLGGTEQVATDLAIWLKSVGHDVRIVAVWKDPAAGEYGQTLRRRLIDAGVPFSDIGGFSFRRSLASIPLRLAREIGTFQPDLVHSHADLPDIAVALTRRLRRFAMARTIHSTTFWPTHPIMGYVAESAFKDDLVVAVSRDAMAAYERSRSKYRLPPSGHRSVISSGIPIPADWEIARRRADRRPESRRRIAFLGRNDLAKGLDVLLDAAAMLRPDEMKGAEFVIHTQGYDAPELRAALERIEAPISLLPPIPNARAHLHEFDLVVMPSRYEGLGLVAVEALAAGTPVLATRVAGLREALPPDWPLMVAPEDPAALADQIRAFIDDKIDLAGLSDRGRKWVGQFSAERSHQRYLEAYGHYLRDIAPARAARTKFA
jgi:glycosyltransferase involved in cell wall biosynthesis